MFSLCFVWIGVLFFFWTHSRSAVFHKWIHWHSGVFCFFTWSAVFYQSRNIGIVVYPKERLALQHSKHSRFSHTGWKPVDCIVSLALMSKFEPWRTYYIIYCQNLGWSMPVLTAHPALGPTQSSFFSGCWTLNEWFNCKQTERDGYSHHVLKIHLDLINS